eukprot:1051321-Amphidinium_carterae.1
MGQLRCATRGLWAQSGYGRQLRCGGLDPDIIGATKLASENNRLDASCSEHEVKRSKHDFNRVPNPHTFSFPHLGVRIFYTKLDMKDRASGAKS